MLKTSSSRLPSLPSFPKASAKGANKCNWFILKCCLSFSLFFSIAESLWQPWLQMSETSYNMFQKVPVWLHLSGGKNGVSFVVATITLSSWEQPPRKEGVSGPGLTNLSVCSCFSICVVSTSSAVFLQHVLINIPLVVAFTANTGKYSSVQ